MSGDVVAFAKPAVGPVQSDLEDFFENGAIGLHLVGRDGTILRANRAELEMMGYEAHEYVGQNIADFHADAATIQDILQKLTAGEKLDKFPARLRTKSGAIRHVLISSSARFNQGEFINTRCFTVDVTEAQKAHYALAEREAHYRQILDAIPAAVYTTDANGIVTYFNRASVEFSGRVPNAGRDHWCVTWRLFTTEGEPLSHDQCPMAVALREKKPVRDVEAVAERPDGTRVPFKPYPTPLFDKNGTLVGAVNMLVDISYQKKAEEQHSLLVRELHHRVKNTLATVQAIMGSTIRFSETMEDFQQSFIGRIGALSKTHSLLTETQTQRVGFKTLLSNELGVFDDGKDRVRLLGKEVLLPAHLAVPVGMAIHELTTNAAKYGALSMIGGTLRVQWCEIADCLAIDWREENVPHVREPERSGFGSQLLNRVLPQQIGAKVEMEYLNGGLHAQFSIPLTSPP